MNRSCRGVDGVKLVGLLGFKRRQLCHNQVRMWPHSFLLTGMFALAC